MGMFDRVTNAAPTIQSVYFLDGIYLVEIKALKAVTSWKGENCFVAECHILESDNPERPVGSDASWVVKMSHESAPGNVKAFVMELCGVTKEAVDGAGVEALCSDEQPVAGFRVRLRCVTTMTQKNPHPFTKHIWSRYEGAQVSKSAAV